MHRQNVQAEENDSNGPVNIINTKPPGVYLIL